MSSSRFERSFIVIVALSLAACGGDDDPGGTGTGGASSGGASSGGASSGGASSGGASAGGSSAGGGSGATGGSAAGGQGGTATGGAAGTGGSGGGVACTPSGPIVLDDGPKTLANLCITSDDMGVVGGNATFVTTLSLTNVTIQSKNYGVYVGHCDEAIFDHVDITTDPQGGDSYSVRGTIAKLTSSSSIYRAGIKAFRVYGLMSGSSTGDTFIGGRLMLGGGPASEWDSPLPFQNFKFTGGSVDVNSVEIYDATHHVEFDGVDFNGTGHISIQFGAHDLTFKASKNLPEIRYYDDAGDKYDPTPSELAARKIVVQP
jgi:hypothetical protein